MKVIGLETEALASLLVADARTERGFLACARAAGKGYSFMTHAADFREMERWFTLVRKDGKSTDAIWNLLKDLWNRADPVTSVVRTFLSHEAMGALNLFGQIGWNGLARRALFALDTLHTDMSPDDARAAFEGKSERFTTMIRQAIAQGSYEVRIDNVFGYHRDPSMIAIRLKSEQVSAFSILVKPEEESGEAKGKENQTGDSLHDHLFWGEIEHGLDCYVSNDKTFDYCRCDHCTSIHSQHRPALNGLMRKSRGSWESLDQLTVR